MVCNCLEVYRLYILIMTLTHRFSCVIPGLGVLLVVVVGVGWKCTPRGHEPLHALFNLGDFRRRSRRHRERRRRDGRWYGGT